MNHVELLKRAFSITWRYRPLWLFGFFLALCGGGSGGGGTNFNFPGGGGGDGDFGDLEDLSQLINVDLSVIIALIVGLFCFVLLVALLGVIIQAISRTALIGMVGQIRTTQAVTVADGWRSGWSSAAWRLFLVGLVIGIPLVIITIFLIAIAFAPLLLVLTENSALTATGIVLTVLTFLAVILILIVLMALISPFQELAWRRTVLESQGVFASLSDTFGFIKQHLKDVIIVWLLMVGVGIGWAVVALIVILPISLIAAGLAGIIPAGVVYLVSNSMIGAAVAGVPLAILILILVSSFANAFYLIFHSAVWTLAYLDLQETAPETPETPDILASAGSPTSASLSTEAGPEN